MSLLLEALKKAEKAKEEAQQRARAATDSRAADDDPPKPADGRHVRTRDELPDISQPLEIHSEDLGAEAPRRSASPALGLVDDPPPRAPEPPPRRPATGPAPEASAADRSAAKRVFEAKYKEPNPRLQFYVALGFLGAACAGTAIYFYLELRPPPPLVNVNPVRPTGEKAVEVAATPPATAVASIAAKTAAPQIPGVPAATTPPATPATTPPATPAVAPAVAPAAAPVPPAPAPAAAAQAVAPAATASPAPAAQPPAAPARSSTASAAAPAAAPRPPPAAAREKPPVRESAPSLQFSQPQPQVNPRVQAAYAAYNSGDLATARSGYEQALREEPANRDALLGLAAVEALSGRSDAADSLYRRLLQADPRDPHAQAGLIALRNQSIDPVQAESRVKNLLASSPDANVLYFTLGNQYAEQRRWPEAQQAYFKAFAADPENADFAYNLAVSLDHLRQGPLAREYYERALALAARRQASFDQAAARARVQQLAR